MRGKTLPILIDTGSDASLIASNLINLENKELKECSKKVSSVTGDALEIGGKLIDETV